MNWDPNYRIPHLREEPKQALLLAGTSLIAATIVGGLYWLFFHQPHAAILTFLAVLAFTWLAYYSWPYLWLCDDFSAGITSISIPPLSGLVSLIYTITLGNTFFSIITALVVTILTYRIIAHVARAAHIRYW